MRALGPLLLLALACRGEDETAPVAPAELEAPCDGVSVLRITARAGEYLHAVASQEARDVVLTVSGPGGRPLLQVDSLTAPNAPTTAEEVHWVADAQGELRIALTLSAGSPGPCALRLAARRPATPADRRRALAEAALAHGHAQRRTRRPEPCRTGIAPYENAEHGFADLGLPARRAEAILGLAYLQHECLHDDAAALATFARTAPFFAGNPALEALARQYLGTLRSSLGDLDGAITEHRRALVLHRQLGDRVREAQSASYLGYLLHLRGRYDEAATAFDRALDLWQPVDDPARRGTTLFNRGQLHRDLGEADRARERFLKALELFRQAQDRDLEAATRNALGLLALDAGQPGIALAPLQAALALRSPGSRGWAITRANLGLANRQLGRLEEARQAYMDALPILRGAGDLRGEARSLGNLGWLETSAGNDLAALAHFDLALERFRTVADPPHTAWALEGKARVLRRRGDLAAARALMVEALATVERHRVSQTSHTTRAEFFATQQDAYDFSIDLLMEMHANTPAAGYAAAALEVSERSLARSLLDGLAASGIGLRGGGTAPELRARERELEAEIEALLWRQTEAHGAEAPHLRSIEASLRHSWEELDRVRAGLRASDPRYAALTQPRPWSAAGIQRQLLDRDTLLLEYRLGKDRSFLWAVTVDSLATFELPPRAVLEEAARQACGLLTRSRSRKAELSAVPRLARLSRLLLGPVAPLLPGKRLLVVGDGALRCLPFAALPEPEPAAGASAGEPLVARHEVVTLPSASALGVLRRQVGGRPPAPKTLWVLADPAFGRWFPPLPHTRWEAEAILALAPAAKRFAVVGHDARRAAVLGSALRDYRFLHFATHGSFAAADPGGGKLVLAQTDRRGRRESNGFLHLADIYELDLRADLVVLSACGSALGRELRGEGTMGMTRGFFYAGAERVLVSLWNVNDEVSAELMRRFYRGMLAGGLSPAAALRAAQDDVRRQPRWRSPYYWAGFTLQGEWRGERSAQEGDGLAGEPASPVRDPLSGHQAR